MATTEKENAKTLADPVTMSKTDHDNTPVNGVGMAPYMISVALFVCALSTNMIFANCHPVVILKVAGHGLNLALRSTERLR